MAQRFSRKYTTYMDGPGWTHRKLRYFATHERKCRACGSIWGIQLHHLTYERLGQEHDWDLVPLCRQRCRRYSAPLEDPADRRCADPVAELEQFALDALVAPGRVLSGQPCDQGGDGVVGGRATGAVR